MRYRALAGSIARESRCRRSTLHWSGRPISPSRDERFLIGQMGQTLVLHDLTRGATTPIPSIRAADPVWSPDDREIAFTNLGADGSIYAMPAFGGTPRRLFASKSPAFAEDWSSDGRWLAAVSAGQGVLFSFRDGDAPTPLDASPVAGGVDELQFSPDSRWLAYGLNGNSTAVGEVFLATVPPTGQRWQVSVAGGAAPCRSPNRRGVDHPAPAGVLMRVEVDPKPGAPAISSPRRIADAVRQVEPTIDQYAVSKSGKFLVRRPLQAGDGPRDDIHIILNWPSLLNRGGAGRQ